MCFELLNLCICVYPFAQTLCITLSFVCLCICTYPLYRILYFVTFVHLRSPTAQWAYWWAVTYCCIVWIVVRQPIGSLKSLRPVTPNHNKVFSPNQSLLVYSSGILDNTAYLGLSKICKFIQGPINSVYVFPEFFRLNILALKLGLFLHHFWILLETGKTCFNSL